MKYKGIAIPNLANYTDITSLERDTSQLNGGELNVIGLFVAKRVCKMYNGDITSETDKTTSTITFRIKLKSVQI